LSESQAAAPTETIPSGSSPSLGLRAPRTENGAGDGRRLRGEHAVVAYAVVAIAALITIRALVDALDFIGVGWILVLVALPLLPWILPRFADFLKAISPYVQSVKLGALQLDIRAIERKPISVPSSGIFASVPNDVGALSSGTTIQQLLSALRDFRRKGAGPVVVIDLQDGHKWRLPNLYFLTHLLATGEPLVSELVFTEAHDGYDGYLVGTSSPDDFRRQVELTTPAYAAAANDLPTSAEVNLDNPGEAQAVGNGYMAFHQALGRPPLLPDDNPALGWVTAERIQKILAGFLSTAAVDAAARTLSNEEVRTVVDSPHRFVPAKSDGRLSGLVDREAVALAVARAALAEH
jgi:hypothetical protein